MTQNNIVIAVTGGIGSGKSAVCNIIKEAGFPIISCDGVYSELLNDGDFLSSIANEFENVLTPDGAL
ncbi:MAG: dephospho-CoA kinase, partial [Clostridia bacterium]|nr:dephospho-CoA kinase [Clostridia bacterium]